MHIWCHFHCLYFGPNEDLGFKTASDENQGINALCAPANAQNDDLPTTLLVPPRPSQDRSTGPRSWGLEDRRDSSTPASLDKLLC